jgi:hypothetical protein
MKRVLCGFFLCLFAVFEVALWADTDLASRPDLVGAVKNRSGEPISGASTFIYTAGPKLGVGFL